MPLNFHFKPRQDQSGAAAFVLQEANLFGGTVSCLDPLMSIAFPGPGRGSAGSALRAAAPAQNKELLQSSRSSGWALVPLPGLGLLVWNCLF